MSHEITDLGLLVYGIGMAAIGYAYRAFLARRPR